MLVNSFFLRSSLLTSFSKFFASHSSRFVDPRYSVGPSSRVLLLPFIFLLFKAFLLRFFLSKLMMFEVFFCWYLCFSWWIGCWKCLNSGWRCFFFSFGRVGGQFDWWIVVAMGCDNFVFIIVFFFLFYGVLVQFGFVKAIFFFPACLEELIDLLI